MEKTTGIKQQVISRLENPYYGKATLTTLKKIAAARDVGLLVEFVPYSQLIDRVSGTPYVERGYGPETMNVPSFEEEEGQGAFEAQAGPPAPQRDARQPGSAPSVMGDIAAQQGTGAEPTFDLPRPQEEMAFPSFIPFLGTRGLSPRNLISMGGKP